MQYMKIVHLRRLGARPPPLPWIYPGALRYPWRTQCTPANINFYPNPYLEYPPTPLGSYVRLVFQHLRVPFFSDILIGHLG